jgi:hypothetical protein
MANQDRTRTGAARPPAARSLAARSTRVVASLAVHAAVRGTHGPWLTRDPPTHLSSSKWCLLSREGPAAEKFQGCLGSVTMNSVGFWCAGL